MVSDKEIYIDGYWLIHEAGRVISGVTYWTEREGVALAEKILREEFELVNDRKSFGPTLPEFEKVNLVYERGTSESSGIAHFHLFFESPVGPHIYLHHWVDRMTPEDFSQDSTRPMLKRLYEAIHPKRVTGLIQILLEEKLPWEI